MVQETLILKKVKFEDFPSIEGKKYTGIILDVEATGPDVNKDKIIELAMIKFEFTAAGIVTGILEEFSGKIDPKEPISDKVTRLTGIKDEDVKDKTIDEKDIESFLKDVKIIIAHHAKYDRQMCEKTWPIFETMNWGCSMEQVSWDNDEDIKTRALDYLLFRFGYFYTAHRAVDDCYALLKLLTVELPRSKKLVLKTIIDNSVKKQVKLYVKCNYDKNRNEILRKCGYKWNAEEKLNTNEIDVALKEEEIETLKSLGAVVVKEVSINPKNRFSNRI